MVYLIFLLGDAMVDDSKPDVTKINLWIFYIYIIIALIIPAGAVAVNRRYKGCSPALKFDIKKT